MRCDLCGVSLGLAGVVTSSAIRDGCNDVVDRRWQECGCCRNAGDRTSHAQIAPGPYCDDSHQARRLEFAAVHHIPQRLLEEVCSTTD